MSVAMTVKAATTTPYTPIDPKVLSVVAAVTTKHWPGLPVVPKLMLGASDGIYLVHAGIPTYGVSGIFSDHGWCGVTAHADVNGLPRVVSARAS